MRQRVYFGRGASRRLPRVLRALGVNRVFLVTGKQSFYASGAAAMMQQLTPDFVVAERFCDFTENPKIEEVESGVEALRRARADVVVAAGGGSVLDMAKLINLLAHADVAPRDAVLRPQQLTGSGLPLIAVPTTSGSGSEATHFAVVYVGKVKHSLTAPALCPTVALVDPLLTHSLPPAVTAVAGLDVLAQAIESYWSIHSTVHSQRDARRAIALVVRWLPDAVNSPSTEARRSMSKASHLAGRAINITKTTGAHALSYPLTSYFGIPHGHAVSLTLGRWLLYNSQVTDEDVADPRGAAFVRGTIAELIGLLGCRDAEESCDRIEALIRAVGLPTRLGPLGISRREAIEIVVPNVNVERVVNNPRALTSDSLRQLVEAVC